MSAVTGRLDSAVTNNGARAGNRRPPKFDYLVTCGFITRDQLAATMVEARDQRVSIEALLMTKYEILKSDIGLSLSLFYHCPFIPFDKSIFVPPDLVKDLSRERLTRGGWIPIKREGDTLTVVTKDPYDLPELDAIGHFFPGDKVRLAVAFQEDIRALIDETLHAGPRTIFEDVGTRNDPKDVEPDDADSGMEAEVKDSDSTIIRLARQIIEDAHHERASDIHIEPCSIAQQVIIRFRVDGTCFEYQRIPGSMGRSLAARLKIMAGLDIAERRKPQDGKIRTRLLDRALELRVATIPTIRGNEDVVLRLLAPQNLIPVEEQGLSEWNLRHLKELINKPYGLFLCVGPTGSGKTTTLHSLLKVLNTSERKIWTAEDPVEVTQAGLRQVQVRPTIGLSFAAIMRAFLRGDPDVIMVGEIRDAETAGICVEASLTGHLVLSTLHTNSAAETVVRLLDLGMDSFNFADALLGVLAQRLLKRLCMECREPYRPAEEEWERLIIAYGREDAAAAGLTGGHDVTLYRKRGCAACRQTGYRGRAAIHELLVASGAIKDRISRKERMTDLLLAATKEGMTTLVQDGVRKVLEGITDLQSVTAVAIR
jgi:type II secretory ATPase GspE/PulE/Tfp pilus assembly ATPase PilB-like protein